VLIFGLKNNYNKGGGKNVSLILIIKGQILNNKKPLKIKGLMPPSTCYQV
jgi:hypothetical protein